MDAARREVWGETGLADIELGPHIWNRRHVVWFNGVPTDVREVWYLARVPAFDIDTAGFTELERDTVLEHRWWAPQGLETTTDLLTPRELATLLRDLLNDGPPARPVTVRV